MSQKQNGPAGAPGHDLKTAKSNKPFNNRFANSSQAQNAPCCLDCAFFELIDHSRRRYPLCHFTGEKYPLPERDGCSFLAGRWSQIDQILGLHKNLENDNVDFPNSERQSDSLYHIPYGENSGISILKSHLSCHKRHEYKLAAMCPVPVTAGGLSLTGEHLPPFCV